MMSSRPVLWIHFVVLALAVGMLGLASPASAVDGVGTRLPLEFRSWRLESEDGTKETLSQLHLPIAVTLEFAPTTRLVVAASGGRSLSSPVGGGDRTLEGMSDTEIQIYQNVPRASLLLFGGVQLPSGVRSLDPSEAQVSRWIANPILGMHLRQYGGGLDFNLGIVWARPLTERTRVSLGLGARFSGAYQVEAGTDDLRPGHQASATLDLLWRGEAWERRERSLGLSASVRVFGSDEQAEEVVFEEGSEFQMEGHSALPLGSASWRSRASVIRKSGNTSYGRAGTVLVPRALASGTGLWFDTSILLPLGDTAEWGPEVRTRFFGGNDIDYGDGWALELGPTLGLPFGEGQEFVLRGALLRGRMGEGDSALELSGFSIGLAANWQFR